MPYSIRKVGKGYKVCKKDGSKCFSKKPLPHERAIAQLKAIEVNSHGESKESTINEKNYKIVKRGSGFKVCDKDTGRCFSKKKLKHWKAIAQLRGIEANLHKKKLKKKLNKEEVDLKSLIKEELNTVYDFANEETVSREPKEINDILMKHDPEQKHKKTMQELVHFMIKLGITRQEAHDWFHFRTKGENEVYDKETSKDIADLETKDFLKVYDTIAKNNKQVHTEARNDKRIFGFVGDCVNILDNPQLCNIIGCYDATELSNLVLSAESIQYHKFKQLVPDYKIKGNLNDYVFSLFQGPTQGDDILIAWNQDTNIHEFFVPL
jgi:hypothetical protein